MKFSIKDFFSKCNQIRRKLWSDHSSSQRNKATKRAVGWRLRGLTKFEKSGVIKIRDCFHKIGGLGTLCQLCLFPVTWRRICKVLLSKSLREKCPKKEFFLVCIFPFGLNTDQKKLRVWILFMQWVHHITLKYSNKHTEVCEYELIK